MLADLHQKLTQNAALGVVMQYRFRDKTTFMVRLHELGEGGISDILEYMKQLHGPVEDISNPDWEKVQ